MPVKTGGKSVSYDGGHGPAQQPGRGPLEGSCDTAWHCMTLHDRWWHGHIVVGISHMMNTNYAGCQPVRCLVTCQTAISHAETLAGMCMVKLLRIVNIQTVLITRPLYCGGLCDCRILNPCNNVRRSGGSTCPETFQFVHYFYGPIILCSAPAPARWWLRPAAARSISLMITHWLRNNPNKCHFGATFVKWNWFTSFIRRARER